jgi:hypothetical protein
MRRTIALVAALSLLAVAAGTADARTAPPAFPTLPGDWSHAEINVTIRQVPHTLILDRGRVTQASTSQITLREADRSVVVVALSPQTIIMLGRFTVTANTIRRGMYAETMRIDSGAAVRVRLTLRP